MELLPSDIPNAHVLASGYKAMDISLRLMAKNDAINNTHSIWDSIFKVLEIRHLLLNIIDHYLTSPLRNRPYQDLYIKLHERRDDDFTYMH